jgi:DNA-binding transcriptional LysR family regulator
MDLRQLRYFVVLADELHFRRAAERLNITQAPLSLAIQGLERELGATLFNRTQRHVELTESGAALRVEARAILERVQRSRETIRDLADGITGSLRIGVTPACCLMPFFGNLVSAFRSARPKVRVTVHEMSSMDQLVALQARELDAAILRNPPERFASDIALTKLMSDPLVIAMNSKHRLSDRSSLTIAELRDESFVNYPGQSGVGIYEQIIALCALRGFTPRVVHEAGETLTLLGLASAGFGLAFVPSGLTHITVPNLIFKPLSDPDATTSVCLGSHAEDVRPALTTFRRMARAVRVRDRRGAPAST